MCGIIGYIGKKKSLPLIIDGLRRMEYRGYDSAGVATIEKGTISCTKQAGRLAELEKLVQEDAHAGTVGIGHTRWATHGEPNQTNAHPHWCEDRSIAIAHNGIIENHATLRKELEKDGYTFITDTDSEILAHLLDHFTKQGASLEEAVKQALTRVTGTYGLLALSTKEPDKIVAARFGSPVILGIVKKGEYIIASDVAAIVNHTRDVIYVEEGEVVSISPEGYSISSQTHGAAVERPTQQVEWDIEQIEKGGYEHFMLKEIFEQPESITNTMRGRVIADEGMIKLGGVRDIGDKLGHIKKIVIVGGGTSYHAGLLGEYWFEKIAGIPTEVELASEFRYRAYPADNPEEIAVIFVSQSGETADSIAALREAKRRGFLTIGIVNVVGSTIARETHAGVYNHAGPEIAVASTKAFTSQLIVILMLAVMLGRKNTLDPAFARSITETLVKLPGVISKILEQAPEIQKLAKKYASAGHMLFIGRKHSYPVALEGALKLKEVSYIHAEGYAAGELKHGPIALIEDSVPTVVVMPHDDVYEKTLSNMEEIKARSGKIIVVTDDKPNGPEAKKADDTITLPYVAEILSPLTTTIPLQLLSYYVAVERGVDVDKPRNLAKSVTVE